LGLNPRLDRFKLQCLRKNGMHFQKKQKINYIPTGILKQVQEPEYCEMYEEIKKVHQGQRGKITPDEFPKKYKG